MEWIGSGSLFKEEQMAGDWIKMRGGLIDVPEVVAMSRTLQTNKDFMAWLAPSSATAATCVSSAALRCVTCALLLRVWSTSREHGKFDGDDLLLPHNRLSDLDQFAGAPGVGEAMKKVGWATSKGGVTLPNFKKYNVPLTPAERQKHYRERVTPALRTPRNGGATNPLPEKSREEKREDKDACWARTCEAYDKRLGREAVAGEIDKLGKIVNDLESNPVVIDGTAQDPFDFAILCMGELPPDATRPHQYLSTVIDRCRRDHAPPGRAPLSTPAAPNVNAIAERLKSLSGTAK